jgi:carboxypeptidase PM20D1
MGMASKKIGLIAGAGVGAAAAAALRRRWSSRGTDDEGGTIGPIGQRLLERLGAAVRIPTVSYEEREKVDTAALDEMHRFLEENYPLLHRHLNREVVAGHSLLFTWEGTDREADPIVLMAHLDVVPVEPGTESEWPHPPFGGKTADGYLWGRGALDDKASLIGIGEAVEALLSEGFAPAATVYLVFGHDEEIGGSEGASTIATLLEERGVRPRFVIDEGGAVVEGLLAGIGSPVALVGIAEKGYVNLELTAVAEGGHSSTPPVQGAIDTLARAIGRLGRRPMPAHLETQRPFFKALAPVLPRPLRLAIRNLDVMKPFIERRLAPDPMTNALIRTTIAVTMVSGGVKPNVIPQQASATANVRIMPGDTSESVIDHVRRVVGPAVTVRRVEGGFTAEPSDLSSTESDSFALVAETVRETFGEIPVVPWILMGATDSRHFLGIAGDVYRFAPFRATPDDMTRIHGTGERLRTADADRVVAFYRRLITAAVGEGSTA